jgi:hypothetical protein
MTGRVRNAAARSPENRYLDNQVPRETGLPALLMRRYDSMCIIRSEKRCVSSPLEFLAKDASGMRYWLQGEGKPRGSGLLQVRSAGDGFPGHHIHPGGWPCHQRLAKSTRTPMTGNST